MAYRPTFNAPRHPHPPVVHPMIRLLTLFVLFAHLAVHAHAHPVDWLYKLSSSAREDGSWLWGWAWASDGTVSIVDRSPPVTFPARPASFGTELTDPLLGYVIPLSAFTAPCPLDPSANSSHYFKPNPIQGCPELCPSGPHKPDPTESWIALVQRGGCPFVEKARQAQRLGARAVVVGGDKENPDALLNMYSERDSSDVTIAATFIKYWDYVELLSMISSSNTSHGGLKTHSILLSTEFSAWEWPFITFVIILLLPSLLTFITLLVHRFRAVRAAQRDRAPEDIVHSFPWRVWTGTGWEKHEPTFPLENADAERDVEQGLPLDAHPSTSHDVELPAWVEEQDECAICLENFAKGDRVRVLPCYHMFHLDEVDEWLIHKKKLCPVCKLDVTRSHPPPPHHAPVDLHSEADDHASTPAPASSPLPPTSPSPEPSERTPLLQDNTGHRHDGDS